MSFKFNSACKSNQILATKQLFLVKFRFYFFLFLLGNGK